MNAQNEKMQEPLEKQKFESSSVQGYMKHLQTVKDYPQMVPE